VVALIVSVLIHAVILFYPQIHFPREKIILPPLNIRLEAESTHEVNSVAKPKTLRKDSISDFKPARNIGINTSEMLQSKKMEGSLAVGPLPRLLYLFFLQHKEVGGSSGEALHRLELNGDTYSLTAITNIQGYAVDQFSQVSHGVLGVNGIVPQYYSEEQVRADGKKSAAVNFYWDDKNIKWSNGATASLSTGLQDGLSFMYQFSQMAINKEIIRFPVANISNLEQYEIEVGAKETLDTPFGKLQALHLRKMHAPGEAYFELWLGLEYRLLPVKLRQINAAGEVVEEMVVSDIRAAD
jgi:hypothetical protein